MRALTLKPHWAYAVAHLNKRCENRCWPIPPALVGQRIAIHAGATLPRTWSSELVAAVPDETRMPLTAWRRIMHTGAPSPAWIRKRVIVATAVLMGCESDGALNRARWSAGVKAAPADWQEWADPDTVWRWCLDDVRTLAKPIPWERGQFGLCNLPDDVAQTVNRRTLLGPKEVT